MKYLFIQLNIIDGEREYEYRVVTETELDDINYAAQKYAADFWGESEFNPDTESWIALGGEIEISVEKVIELTESDYKKLSNLFYGSI